MDDRSFLEQQIPGYAGYGSEEARHRVDAQVRSWLGEALAATRERLAPEPALAERIDDLVLRCEFADQLAVRASDHVLLDEEHLQQIYAADRAIVEAAARVRGIDAAGLGALLDEVGGMLDARSQALTSAARR